MSQILEWDRDLLVYFNSMHAPWADTLMFQLTRTEFWIPLYLVLLFLVFKENGKQGWIALLCIAFTIIVADQVTSGIMKPLFHRLRPSHEPGLTDVLHIVNDYRGGMYGFASSHAANTMGIATFIYLLFRQRFRWITWIFLWAFIMSYTRIYLGVHYPGDIIVGAMVGIGAGISGFWIYRKLISKRQTAGNSSQ